MFASLSAVNRSIISCARCPRLRSYCRRIAREKKREFGDWTYWGKPVPGFGDPRARVLIVGLAPAAHGANRTGRMFTGDSSGRWLYEALHRFGFASQPESLARDDGLTLIDCYITAAARCAPPVNKPSRLELERCRRFLGAEVQLLSRVRAVVTLGHVAHEGWLKSDRVVGSARAARPAAVSSWGGERAAGRHSRHRVVSPESAEHQHRKADARDVVRGVSTGAAVARVYWTANSALTS